MSNSIRMIAILVLVCVTGLGVMLAFGLLGQDQFLQTAGKVLAGAGVLLLAGFALTAVSGGTKSTDQTEPPPRL